MFRKGLLRGGALFAACLLLGLVLLPVQSGQAQEGGRRGTASEARTRPSDLWAVLVTPGTDAAALAAQYGFEYAGAISILPDTHVFRLGGSADAAATRDQAVNLLSSAPQVVRFEQQFYVERATRGIVAQEVPMPIDAFPVGDPFYPDQWHLENRGQSGGTVGVDANLQPAWDMGMTGSGVQIVVVDDGLQYTHPDLAPNYNPVGSFDFNDGNPDPAPNFSFDIHGTAASGVAAAALEGTCGVGAAFNAALAGVQILSTPFTTDSLEAQGIGYALDVNDISSNSWGPLDTGDIFGGVGPLALAAIEQGALTGRGGLGTVYVWAGGNGQGNGDYANADAYVSSRYTIGVAASDLNGEQSSYSESGAALLVNAPSSGAGVGITTTDSLGSAGYNGYPANLECTNVYGGTSSATPLVAGVVALMLEANPTLTWRDVQHILVETAIKNDPTDSDWVTNDAGFHVNHKYGFGRVDAFAAVNLAQNWQNVSPNVAFASPVLTVNQPISANAASPTTATFNVAVNDASFRLEHVVVRFNAVDIYRGDLEITLTAPSGTQSVLMIARPFDAGLSIVNYDLMSTRNWGENPNGTWTISVKDVLNDGFNGTFVDWQLTLYGNTGSTPQQVAFITQPPTTQTGAVINAPSGIRVGLFDRHGVALDLDNVPVTVAVSQGSGALIGTLTRMTVDGVATFSDLRLGAPGEYILSAVSPGYDPAYSDPFIVYAGIDDLVFLTQPENDLVGGDFAPSGGIKVAVVDAAGSIIPVNGQAITLAVGSNPGGGAITGTVTANTAAGVATFTGLSLNQPGFGYTLIATSGSLTAESAPFDILPADVQIVFAAAVNDAHFNQILNAPAGVVIEMRDATGTLIPANGMSVTLSAAGPGVLRGTTSALTVNGRATFANLYIDAPGMHTLNAVFSPLPATVSNSFEITTLTGQFCASTYDAGWTGSLEIPDDGFIGVGSTITIPALGFDPITDIDVTLDIRHTYVGDLELYLEHDGIFSDLVVGADGYFCSGNDISIIVDDEAALSTQLDCVSGANPTQAYMLGGRYQPETPLSAFDGGALEGDWTLLALDTFPLDMGVIFEWCINADLPPVKLVFVDQPTNTPQFSPISTVTVEVQDLSGMVVPVDNLPITLSLANNPPNAPLLGTLTVNTVNGVATFSDLQIDVPGVGYTLEAASGGLMTDTSDAFDILAVNMIENGDFANGLTAWNVFDAITWQIPTGTFEFYRNQGGESAVVLQDTGLPTSAGETLTVDLDLGNSSPVRKRVSVLVHNTSFTDLQICSFWLAPNTPLATYQMYLGAQIDWDSTVLSIYGSPDDGVGWILVDNVSMYTIPGLGMTETLCVDPTAPAPTGGADSANLIQNGAFTGSTAPWGTFGAIVTRLEMDVLEMYRTFGTPAGSILQNTGVSAPAGTPMEVTLSLGNSSSIRQRATVLIHNQNFSDLQVCVFWLEPGTPLQTHVIRTFSTQAWTGVSLSIYPSPATNLGWVRMDNVSVVAKPSMMVTGTECYMPGSAVTPAVPPQTVDAVPPQFIPAPNAQPELPLSVPYQPAPEGSASAEGSFTE